MISPLDRIAAALEPIALGVAAADKYDIDRGCAPCTHVTTWVDVALSDVGPEQLRAASLALAELNTIRARIEELREVSERAIPGPFSPDSTLLYAPANRNFAVNAAMFVRALLTPSDGPNAEGETH